MQVFSQRNAPARYLLVTPHRTVLYEFTGCMHLANGFETVDEVRPAVTASFVAAGPLVAERERTWAEDIARPLRRLVGRGVRVGLERMNAGARLCVAGIGIRGGLTLKSRLRRRARSNLPRSSSA